MRISPGTLMHEYGNRSEMLRRACVQAARDHVRSWNQRWSERWYLAAPERRGPALLLPDHEQELSHERQWGPGASWIAARVLESDRGQSARSTSLRSLSTTVPSSCSMTYAGLSSLPCRVIS